MIAATVTVATSIAPKDIERQKKAVTSWIAAGFTVISLNNPDEIPLLRRHFPELRFLAASRNGVALAGKPLVYLSDILVVLKESGSDICGIINSDIIIAPPQKFARFIHFEAKNCLVYGCRIDVVKMEQQDGEEYSGGFDYFFFDRNVISAYSDTHFCLGAPWWDYWMCLTPLIRNIPVKKLSMRIAYHEWHDKNWSYDLWWLYCKHFVRRVVLAEWLLIRCPTEAVKMMIHLATKNYAAFAEDIVAIINKKSITISFSEDSDCNV